MHKKQNKLPNLNAKQLIVFQAIGKGTFGTVYRGEWQNTQKQQNQNIDTQKQIQESQKIQLKQSKQMNKNQKKIIAIKKIFMNPKYKNRELQILGMVSHKNIVKAYGKFQEYDQNIRYKASSEAESEQDTYKQQIMEKNGKKKTIYTFVVMEYIPKTLSSLIRQNNAYKKGIPLQTTIIYLRNILEALQYLHSLQICHRDIKPSNLLISFDKSKLLSQCHICDFGSAKILPSNSNHKSITYICSRYYRAPQLLLSCSSYNTKIDIWSVGCIFVEMLTSYPIFNGYNTINQLAKIIKILGKPSQDDLMGMKVNQMGEIDAVSGIGIKSWLTQRLHQKEKQEEGSKQIDTMTQIAQRMLIYNPEKRFSATQMLNFLKQKGI